MLCHFTKYFDRKVVIATPIRNFSPLLKDLHLLRSSLVNLITHLATKLSQFSYFQNYPLRKVRIFKWFFFFFCLHFEYFSHFFIFFIIFFQQIFIPYLHQRVMRRNTAIHLLAACPLLLCTVLKRENAVKSNLPHPMTEIGS